jgi:hypothetical protein
LLASEATRLTWLLFISICGRGVDFFWLCGCFGVTRLSASSECLDLSGQLFTVGVVGEELVDRTVRKSDTEATVCSSLATGGCAKSGMIMGTYRGNRAEIGDFVAGVGT